MICISIQGWGRERSMTPPPCLFTCDGTKRGAAGKVHTLYFRHLVAPQNMHYSPFHLPLTSLEHLISFYVSYDVREPYNRTVNLQDSRTCFLISGFWNLSASINPRLLKLFQDLLFSFRFLFRVVPESFRLP